MQKHVLKVLGLSLLAALGVMAFAAASAQAGLVQVLTSDVEVGQKIGGLQEGTGALLVPDLSIEIVCSHADVLEGVVLKSGTEAEGLAKILFLGCVVWSINAEGKLIEELKECHILDTGTNAEKDITAKAILLVELLGTEKTLIIAHPDGTGPFAKFSFTKGIGCSLTTPIEIKGLAAYRVVTGNLRNGPAVLEPLIESNKSIQEEHKVKLLYGEHESFIDGSAKLFLLEKNTTCTWGAL